MARFYQFLYVLTGFLVISTAQNFITAKPKIIASAPNKTIEVLDSEDGSAFLSYIFLRDEDLVEFEIEVETTGYVGFGISPNGGMVGADIFIGGVYENGTSYHFVSNNVGILLAKSWQNWQN
jgi:hypothetical protein